MEPCHSCGADVGSDDRFCSQCGRATTSEFELLGAEPAVSEEQVVGWGSRPRGPVLALVVLAALLGLAWLTPGWFAGDDDQPAAEGVAEEEVDEEPNEDTVGPSTTRNPARASTSERATTASDAGPTTVTTQVGEGPLLGQETGLSLLVGGSHVRRLDLDTGILTEYELRGVPMIESGGWLVLSDPNSDRLFAVPVDDPDGDTTVELPRGDFWPVAAAKSDPGFVWLLEFGSDPAQVVHVDLSSGQIVEVREASSAWLGGRALIPDLAVAPDGRIFEWSDGVYRLVGDGGLVAANSDVMLLSSCTDPATCTLDWVDRDSGLVLERSLPNESETYYSGTLSPGSRVLVLWGIDGTLVFDVERGAAVDFGDIPSYNEGIAVSPDERYVAAIDVKPTIVDLDSGESVKINLTTGGYSEILLVASP